MLAQMYYLFHGDRAVERYPDEVALFTGGSITLDAVVPRYHDRIPDDVAGGYHDNIAGSGDCLAKRNRCADREITF